MNRVCRFLRSAVLEHCADRGFLSHMSLLSFAKKVVGTKGRVSPRQSSSVSSDASSGQQDAASDARWALKVGLTPLMTEKSVTAHEHNVVAFRVLPHATKGHIALAVRERYGVTPRAIRTVMMHSKERRRGHTVGRTNRWKKVYVTVSDVTALHIAP